MYVTLMSRRFWREQLSTVKGQKRAMKRAPLCVRLKRYSSTFNTNISLSNSYCRNRLTPRSSDSLVVRVRCLYARLWPVRLLLPAEHDRVQGSSLYLYVYLYIRLGGTDIFKSSGHHSQRCCFHTDRPTGVVLCASSAVDTSVGTPRHTRGYARPRAYLGRPVPCSDMHAQSRSRRPS